MDIKLKSYIFITGSLTGGAMLPIALNVADKTNVSIFAFLFIAYLIAVPASLALVVAKKKTKRLVEYIRNPKEYILLGVIGFANLGFVNYGLFYAEKYVGASLATVIYRMQPILMLLFLPVLLRERVSKIQIAALMLGFLGIYIAVGGGSLSLLLGANAGIIFFLVGMTLIAAFSTVFMKRYKTDMESTMFIFNSVALVVATGLFVYSGASLPALTLNATIAVLYVGLAAVGIPFLYYSAFRVLKTTIVTNLYCLSPFITVLFAAVILKEPVYLYYIAIAALVAAGIIIQRFDKRGGTYMAKEKSASKSNIQIFDVTGAFIQNTHPHIYTHIRGNGRALAAKMNAGLYNSFDKNNYGCIVFTNKSPPAGVRRDEISFIENIMGPANDEVIVTAIGDVNSAERAISEHAEYPAPLKA